jgi:carboxyl-terminal processing protease
MIRRLMVLALVAGVSFGGGAWLVRPGGVPDTQVWRQARVFDRVVDRIRAEYVDSVSEPGLYTEAARAVVASLHDPYAELLLDEDFRAFNDQLAGRALGATSAASFADSVATTSHAHLLRDGIGYVELRAVTERAADELALAVDALRARGMRRLVIDLRYNPGGLIEQGVEVARLFLDAGDTVATLRGRVAKHTRTYVADAPQRWPDLPVALLVGPNTASSAELIAGALQDHGRVTVVGGRTFGKGVVQTTFKLDEDVGLKFTTSRWYTPGGHSVQRPPADSAARGGEHGGGLVPDVAVRARRLPSGDRAFVRALSTELGRFEEAVDGYAAELAADGAVRDESFAVTPAMRGALLARLRAAGLQIESDVYADGAGYVERALGFALARAAFGAEAEFRRRAADDPQVQTAVALLGEGRL